MKLPLIPYPNQVKILTGTVPVETVKTAEIEIDSSLDRDEYKLVVDDNGASILAGGEEGVFYASQTLRQLREASKTGCLSCCEIFDKPKYKHRGFMIDCVRHFFPVEDLKKMIDACAGLKMNVFHWHLTDDQGWRIQIDRYPELTEKASKRPFSDFGRYYEPGEHGGWYSKEEVRDIVAFCKKRFIEVIPEIEMPGHTSAILSVMPEFSCNSDLVQVKTRGGVYKDTLCIGNQELYQVLQNILDEVVELFPGERFHIGGDEAPQSHWQKCEKCQQMMREKGLKNEGELQCFFTNKMAHYLKNKGKKTIVWNDALRGGKLNSDITVQYWIGDNDLPGQHVNNGGEMIMSSYFHYYLDYSYGQTPLNKTYEFEPVPSGIQSNRQCDMLGVEAPIWAEYVPDLKKMSYQCFPRMLAVAETGWTNQENKDVESFNERLFNVLPKFVKMGLPPAAQRLWNMKKLGRIRDALRFWYHAMTKKDFSEFVQHLREEKREEQQK